MKILIDNGHRVNTPGKCSPDGVFQEYKYTREIAAAVVQHLQHLGFDAALVTPEEYDVSLRSRTERVNTWCLIHGKKNAICVSIHFNAHGNGSEWTLASGWAIYTSKGKTAADDLTTSIAETAKINLPAMRLRSDYSDGDIDREEDFYILKHTLCSAVLTENGFMTNEKECRWLQTEEAIKSISKTQIEGIVRYLIQYKNI